MVEGERGGKPTEGQWPVLLTQGVPVPKVREWTFLHPFQSINVGETLRIKVDAAASVTYTLDGWKTNNVVEISSPTNYFDLSTAELPPYTTVEFTFYWTASGNWEGKNFTILANPC